MDRARAIFIALFLALPLLLALAAVILPGANLGLALASILILITGFVIGLGFVEP